MEEVEFPVWHANGTYPLKSNTNANKSDFYETVISNVDPGRSHDICLLQYRTQ